MNKKSVCASFLFIVSVFFILLPQTFAATFDLIPPTGTSTRGQDITFTINISTAGESVTSIQTGLTYDSTLLKYISFTAGAAMNSVIDDQTSYGPGKVLFTGKNNTGYNGTGVFATVVFNIIAQSSGQTDICSLWVPTPTPTIINTPIPTQASGPVCGTVCTTSSQCPADMPCYILAGQTSGYCRRTACPEITSCVCPLPTSPPAPTALPQTGSTSSGNAAIAFAGIFILAAGGVFFLSQKQKYSLPDSQPKKHHHKTAK